VVWAEADFSAFLRRADRLFWADWADFFLLGPIGPKKPISRPKKAEFGPTFFDRLGSAQSNFPLF